MNNKAIYIAFVLDKGEWGHQLIRYAFEHPIVEYFGEPEEQAKLQAYFKKHHYSKANPLIIESSDLLDFMAYISPKEQL